MEELSREEEFVNRLWGLTSNTTTSSENINIDFTDDDELPPLGGVREPRNPVFPFLPGLDTVEKDKEYEFDLCICAN